MPSLPGELSEWELAYLPIRGPDGESLGMLAHAENLTMQHRNERLQRETEQLRRVLDCSFVYIGLLSPEGMVLEINRRRWRPPASAWTTCARCRSGRRTGGRTTRPSMAGCATRCRGWRPAS